jgi:rubredoxin
MPEESSEEHTVYVCGKCGYTYNPKKGDKKQSVPPGVLFNNLPDEWVCPLCGVGKNRFTEMP